MKHPYMWVLVICSWLLSAAALTVAVWPKPLPMVSTEDLKIYMAQCREDGGFLGSAAYVSQQRAMFICYTWNEETQEEVVLDVYFK